ncbi:MAG: MmcQ/YjbR family DNA-binding protein [Tenuifilaceae bacterium]|jgi:predicted DNA-binding protein (MmcQ/YjbR family)|uniref:MmcQ/YjbR family DNA-binding protein n=1 Tax=Perlabentimonas gracilis TaxID=2715279 RepID=UPI00140815AA|nr:MmcQ/YjbR family DNA-binding protein [Perlabentimonas gracilis]MDX9770286.1 MmcQ/YjbR family DNA-binding protein [Tenuifilaceae bacterium]NHB68964.1 MmcQ/YjbR family DNA-binding protein [Perlabentimonas gracilis]
MNVEEIRNYCISLKGATESFPFDDVTLVFKVGGKMFALLSLDDPLAIGLKCDPDLAIELREHYPCVTAGYHMNKKHWNTVLIDGSVKPSTIQGWIDDSYKLILESLPKIKRNAILNQ